MEQVIKSVSNVSLFSVFENKIQQITSQMNRDGFTLTSISHLFENSTRTFSAIMVFTKGKT